MQQYITPQAGRTPPEPNIVNTDEYKMHILKREWSQGEHEILIERWIPETGWTRTQILCDDAGLLKIGRALGF
jgi:hypothetical protein